MNKNIIKSVYKNIILFICGFCIYITIENIFRGYSFVLMGVCGGLCVVILDKLNDYISWKMDLFWQAFIGVILITSMELIVGIIAKYTTFLPVMWDYSNLPLNYDGIICVPFSLAWFFLSLVAIFLADSINYYVLEDGERPHYILFGKFIFWFKKKKCDKNLWFENEK